MMMIVMMMMIIIIIIIIENITSYLCGKLIDWLADFIQNFNDKQMIIVQVLKKIK
jgi:hypothetical protein